MIARGASKRGTTKVVAPSFGGKSRTLCFNKMLHFFPQENQAFFLKFCRLGNAFLVRFRDSLSHAKNHQKINEANKTSVRTDVTFTDGITYKIGSDICLTQTLE